MANLPVHPPGVTLSLPTCWGLMPLPYFNPKSTAPQKPDLTALVKPLIRVFFTIVW